MDLTEKVTMWMHLDISKVIFFLLFFIFFLLFYLIIHFLIVYFFFGNNKYLFNPFFLEIVLSNFVSFDFRTR